MGGLLNDLDRAKSFIASPSLVAKEPTAKPGASDEGANSSSTKKELESKIIK